MLTFQIGPVRLLPRFYPEMTRWHRLEICGQGSGLCKEYVECKFWAPGE